MNYLFSQNEKLIEIESLMLKGEYRKAIESSDEIIRSEEYNQEEKIGAKIAKALNLGYIGIFEYNQEYLLESLNLAEEAFKESKKINNPLLIFFSFIARYSGYFNLSRWDETIKIVEEIDQFLSKTKFEDTLDILKIEAFLAHTKSLQPVIRVFCGENLTLAERDEAIYYAEKSVELCDELIKKGVFLAKRVKIVNFQNMAEAYITMGDYEKGYELLEKTLKIIEETGNKYVIANTYAFFAYYHRERGEFELFLDYTEKELRILEELGNKRRIAALNNEFGLYYSSQGERELALEYFERSLDFFQKAKEDVNIARSLQNCGFIHKEKGNLDKALDFFEEAYKIFKEIQPQFWWSILSDIGDIYRLKGELDKALEFKMEYLFKMEILCDKAAIASSFSDLSLISWQNNEKEQALEYAQKGLKLRIELQNDISISWSLHLLIRYTVELEEIDLAEKYYEDLKQINREIENKPLIQRLRFSEALIFKASQDPRERGKAELLFEKLLEEDLPYDLYVNVLLNISELLVYELKITKNEKILSKLDKYAFQLNELAIRNNSHLLIIESLWFQSQLALVELQIDKAKSLLSQALAWAEKNNLEQFEIKFLREKEKLISKANELQKLGETKPTSIFERMDVIRIDETLKDVKRVSMTEARVEEIDVMSKLFSIKI